MKRAWRVTLMGINSVVAGNSRGQAIARTLSSAHEAGYYSLKFTDARARRAREFDGWAEVDYSNVPWNENELPKDKPAHA